MTAANSNVSHRKIRGISRSAKRTADIFRIPTAKTITLYIKGKTKTLGYLRNKHDNWKNVLRDLLPEKIVDKKLIPLEFDGSLSLVNIWDGETANITLSGDDLCVEKLRYGMLLRFEKDGM